MGIVADDWTKQQKKKKSVESWSQLFQGTDIHYTLMGK